MPTYTFDCGEHQYDRRVDYSMREQECAIGQCHRRAIAQSVYYVNNTHPRFWGGDLPDSVAEARDHYLHYAAEVKTGLAEEVANGF